MKKKKGKRRRNESQQIPVIAVKELFGVIHSFSSSGV